MTEIQTDRIACQMVRMFGLKAQGEAAALCRKIAARSDMEGMKSWTEIRRKICALQLVHGDGELSATVCVQPRTRGMIHAVI